LKEWARRVDVEAIGRARPRVWFDAMHGSGAGVLDVALLEAGARVEVLRADPDPRFGGSPPDPRPEQLHALRRAVRSGRGLRLGLATDGDADRFAVVDADGRVLSESEAVALLVDHLARTGRIRAGVALSLATGGLAERVARAHGLRVERYPLGFSHLAAALESGGADVAADESGGFAWGRVGPGKDGLLAGGLLTEIVAETRAPLSKRIADLERRHGRSCCARTAVPATPSALARFDRLCTTPPARVAGEGARVEPMADGLRLLLDDGFLVLRASSTEPVLRVYAEAAGPARVRRRLAAGRSLLGAG
jgi:phosphomannomutase